MTVYAEVLAEYVTRLRFADIPSHVLRHTKFVLMDSIGCAIGGARLGKGWTEAALHVARNQGGAEQATIWHYGDRAPSLMAAFVNGILAHSMDFSDDLAGIHIGGIVPTTAFAIAEGIGASGRDVITATVIGYDIAGRLAEGMDSQGLYLRGLQPTAMLGGFAAAATAGKLLDLDANRMANAFGIVGSYTGGTIEFLKAGTDTKRLHPGKCGHSGALAALLARGGMTGPHSVFEGVHGVFKAYSDNPNLPKLAEELGSRFDILDTSIKPLPMCDGNFAPIEATLALMADHGLGVADIANIHCVLVPSLIPYAISFHGDSLFACRRRPATG
jgi:2-methylcitrate dehydratase PrpD